MHPSRTHANGVPWLIWTEGRWECEECGRSGQLPEFDGVAVFARSLGDLKRYHAACRPGGVGPRPGGAIGDPLNWDRIER